ncbi:MAG: insulinase family protein [Bacteroidetes bacterium]|nr:insulinase family protein [Bacteroidota bacterium]
MKKLRFLAVCIAIIATISGSFAQGSFKYESVPNDPLGTRIYTLENGLKVYLTVYKETPRIYTAIAVRTGSKNDPADNTGLSHYLEHMMFKGTTHFGTSDYAKEAPLLKKIEDLFEEYRSTTDTIKRTAIYHHIDSISGIAASYAIANEYDKLVSVIGAKGTNAFTSTEETVYINDIPSNEIDNWLKIESDRFSNPVFRIFHTELEAVYEEKNMSLDRDGDKVEEELYAGLFSKHPYGTQTTIGTIEHLKNPSLKSLKQYFTDRYAPNNMALVMAGDFDPDSIIGKINKSFSVLEKKKVEHFVSPVEDPITKPIVKEVVGPDAESVTIGFRTGGIHTPDADLVSLCSDILSNGKAGLIDLNLKLAQKVLSANAGAEVQTDYSTLVLTGKPKEGQKLEEVKDLLLDQIQKLKSGEFPDWLVPAILNNMKLSRIKQQESNNARAMNLVSSFIMEQPYEESVTEIDRLEKITKPDIIGFAQRTFKDNYVVVYKRTGVDNNVRKVTKPSITPVVMERNKESAFYNSIVKTPVLDIKPKFIDYSQDIKQFKTSTGVNVIYLRNTENKTFNLSYYFEMGSQNDLKLATAVNYLSYLGTTQYTAEQLKQEFYKLGCSYSVAVGNDDITISLSGLADNTLKALSLLEQLLAEAKPDDKALSNLVQDIIKSRSDNKLNKNTIRQGLSMYAAYGPKSPFTNILNETELNALRGDELVALIHGLTSYKHDILYYGPMVDNDASGVKAEPGKMAELGIILDRYHRVPAQFKPVPPRVKYPQLPTDETKVFAVDYKMKQVDIVLHSKSVPYDPSKTAINRMFNEYFGGGMNSIVFQEIREAKALAYSSSASYRTPSYPDENNTIYGFVGTQNDKMPEALKTMFSLFNDMPESEKSFAAAKEAILNQISSERITKMRLINNFLTARRFGFDHDIRKDVYEQVPALTFADILGFQQQYLKNKNFTILLVGNTKKFDQPTLESYGKVTYLDLKDIFGY